MGVDNVEEGNGEELDENEEEENEETALVDGVVPIIPLRVDGEHFCSTG